MIRVCKLALNPHRGNRAFYISVHKKLTNLQSHSLLYFMSRNLLNGMCGNNRIAISIDRDPYVFNFAVPILSLPSYTASMISKNSSRLGFFLRQLFSMPVNVSCCIPLQHHCFDGVIITTLSSILFPSGTVTSSTIPQPTIGICGRFQTGFAGSMVFP